MHSSQKRGLYYALCAFAITASLVSLFTLFALGAQGWTTSLNVLALVCLVFALKMRNAADGTDRH